MPAFIEKALVNGHIFALRPFESGPVPSDFSINGVVKRLKERLVIDYKLMGPLDKVFIRPSAKVPVRMQDLWKETCFECFIGTDSKTRYWEINLSPAGHWNVYQFDDYRSGMQEDTAFRALESVTESAADWFRIRCGLDLNGFGLVNTRIRIGLCAILRTADLKLMYWAIAHPGPKPDFHRQDGFVLEL